MPFQPEGLDARTLKRLAQRLRKGFQQQFPDVPCSPHQSQAILATMLGHPSWHAALKVAAHPASKGPSPAADPVVKDPVEWEWAKAVISSSMNELGHLSCFELGGTALFGEEALSPVGLFPVMLVALVMQHAPELLNNDAVLLTRHYPSVMELVVCVQPERLPSHWTPAWVGKALRQSLETLPKHNGRWVLDRWYDQFADLVDHNTLRFLVWSDGSIG